MMKYYGVESRFSAMKEWYDGYMFSKREVYNPWGAVNHVCDLYADIKAFPRPPHPAVLAGAHPFYLFKDAGEVVGLFHAAFCTDSLYGAVCETEHVFGAGNAFLLYILADCKPVLLFKGFCQTIFVNVNHLCKGVE